MTTIDPPAVIAVLGAGPIGIEAALYARFLGYRVILIERGQVATNLQSARNQPLWGPFGEHVTSLGISALRAQQDTLQPPVDEARLTIGDWLDSYLLPLAASDLLADSVRLATTAVAIQTRAIETEEFDEDAEHWDVSIESPEGRQTIRASTVIDVTGTVDSQLEVRAEEICGDDLKESLRVRASQLAGLDGVQSPQFFAKDLVLDVPYVYCIGAKSFDGWPDFRLEHGFAQIRDLFKLIADRDALDLYANDLE